ncbi:formyl transferase [Aliikangiella maris]|uniref:Formyl transferase n=2 Tax=Aliikangiella maris TaxID=3162458 RepID=A0ABV2BR87_9GAMM
MNIIFLINRDIASNYALNLILPHLKQTKVHLVYSSQVGRTDVRPANRPAALAQLQFFEQTLPFELLLPKYQVNYCTDFPRLNRRVNQSLSIASVHYIDQINSESALTIIKAIEPDLMVSIRFGAILKSPVIRLSRLGVINLHSGVLPDYRGVMATFRAMLNGEKEIGTTLHYIQNHQIDCGDIIQIDKIPVEKNRSYLWHVLKLYESGVLLILDAIATFSKNISVENHLQPKEGKYFSYPSLQNIIDFERRGGVLVDPDSYIDWLMKNYC